VSISAKMGCARAIRARLEFAENLRDLAHFNVAIDSKLSGCDLVNADQVRELVSVIQSKTKRPVQFELTENSRTGVADWGAMVAKVQGADIQMPDANGSKVRLTSQRHLRSNVSFGLAVRCEPTLPNAPLSTNVCSGELSFNCLRRSAKGGDRSARDKTLYWLFARYHSKSSTHCHCSGRRRFGK